MNAAVTDSARPRVGTTGLAALLANLADPVIVIDAGGCIRYLNRAVERVVGWTAEEWLGRSAFEVVHPDDLGLAAASMATIGQKDTGTAIEIRVATADGGWRLLEFIGTNLLDHPEVAGIALVARDLTERRRWEVTGSDGERFRSVVHHAATITMLIDGQGRIDSASGALTQQLGHDPELLTGRPLVELIGERDRARAAELLASAATTTNRTSFETSLRHAGDDRLLPVELSIVNLLDDPVVAGMIVTGQDISRLAAARDATARLAAVVEQSGDAVVGLTSVGEIEHWNAGAARMLGYRAGQVVGQPLTMLVPADQAPLLTGLLRTASGGSVARHDTAFVAADGTRIDVAITLSPIVDDEERFTGLSLIARDITERVRAEAADRESRRQLADAQRLARLGSWAWDIAADVVTWSDELYRVFGLTANEFGASYDAYLDRVHPDDRGHVHAVVADALGSCEPFSLEHRIIRPDGTIAVLRCHGHVETDGHGTAVRMAGAAQDVTDETAALTALRHAEEHTRRILETARDGFVAINLAGVVSEWNTAAERIFGWTRDQAVGQPLAELIIPPEQRAAHRHGLARFAATGEGPLMGQTVEVLGQHRDGHPVPLELTIWALNSHDNQVQVNAFIRDVSERHAAEQALRAGEQRFRLAFDNAPIGMALVAPDGRFLRVNHSLCDLVGRSPDQLLARTFQDITHPDDLQADLERVRQVLAGERATYQMEKRYFHADGHVVWILLAVSLVRDHEGAPLYFISQIEDITARKAADELKDHLVAVTSHELRSPLTSIRGFTSLLNERWGTLDDSTRREAIEVIDRQSRRLQTIVDSLLTLATIEAGAVELDPQPVPIIDVIADVLHASAADADFAVNSPAGLRVLADRNQLEQMLTNYVTNAVKYGTAPFAVDVTDVGDAVEIRVRDHGPGVPAELADRLFEKFSTVPNPASGSARGTGLGLAIVRSLADAHGGTAWYEPNQPGGACFAIRLTKAPDRQHGHGDSRHC